MGNSIIIDLGRFLDEILTAFWSGTSLLGTRS